MLFRSRRELERTHQSAETEIFYEAPHRILAAVEDIVEALGPNRQIVVARELTKIHEELLRGTATEILQVLKDHGQVKGEITLLIGPGGESQAEASGLSVRDRVDEIMRQEKLDEKSALKKVAKERGISKSRIYREFQRDKK